MSEVVVSIPTFRRPELLARLLTELVPQAAGVSARVLVIDNDPEGSAAATSRNHDVDYVLEPARGLAAVRNRAIDEASDALALVFIDDDEVPADAWLATLVDRWRASGAAAVSGRVETTFPAGFSDAWIQAGGFFQRVRFPDGSDQPAAPTNNLLIDLTFVRDHRLRFDEAFGLSGGEDIHFTQQIVARGGRILSCPAALVYDVVDPARLNRKWVLRRAYRVGVTTSRSQLALGGGFPARVKAVAGGVARVVAGGGRWAIGTLTRSPRHAARGARAVWRGSGLAMGALGRRYEEYALR